MGDYGRPESATFTRKIRVLLVDHDKEYLLYLAELLRSCSCKVETVEHATTALSILSEGKGDFDLVIADIHSPDLDLFTHLRTNNMDVLAIPMSADKDDTMVRKAFETGALLVLEKPVTGETLKYMWQLVMREKAKMGIKLVDEDRSSESTGENVKRINESKGKMPQEDIVRETINKKDKQVPKKRGRGRKFRKNDEGCESTNDYNGKKVCTDWTKELHKKFKDAVNQLGEGRCYPKEILARMNVPGLTRMQVASHLQKCRNDNWGVPEVRKSKPGSCNPKGSGTAALKINPRKFGSMPFSPKEANNAQVNLQGGQESHTAPQTSSANNLVNMEDGQNLNTAQTMDYTENVVEATVNYDISPNEMRNLNMNVNEELVVTAQVVDHGNYYHPILSDLNSGKPGIDHFHASSSIQKHPSDDLFDFLPEMEDFMKNYPGCAEPSVNNQSSKIQQCVFGFDKPSPYSFL